MKIAEKLVIKNFTDPMMGLSYESEPFFRRLETHYGDSVELRYVMAGLVRDVYDFVDKQDLAFGEEFAINEYNARLARIYKNEEHITGMPINTEELRLFSTEHTSSVPLNVAYKAAQLADKNKADLFLYNIRFAAIVEGRPTTHLHEIMRVVAITHIDSDTFLKHYYDGSAQDALGMDFKLRRDMSVYGLPAYLFEYAGRSTLVSGVLDYNRFSQIIDELSQGEIKEAAPLATAESIMDLIDRHPLISPIEIKEAFRLTDLEQVRSLIQPLVDERKVCIKIVPHAWFIEKI